MTGPGNAEHKTESQTGTAREGEPQDEPFDLEMGTIWTMEIGVSFQDEASSRVRFTNQPDEFELTVTFPDGESETKHDTAVYQNEKTVLFRWNWTNPDGTGGMDWSEHGGNAVVVTVECTSAGDEEPIIRIPFLGLRDIPDNGNAYTINLFYTYTKPSQ